MATDNKRHAPSAGGKGPGGPIQQPHLGPTGTVSLEKALSGAIGARIRVTTSQPASVTLEGTLFTACPVTNLVAINTSPVPPTSTNPSTLALSQPGDFRILPISRIHNFQLISPPPQQGPASASQSAADSATPFADAHSTIYPLELKALKNREAAAVARLQEKETQRGKGVSKEAQDLFDAFSRTMPARWDGTSIVVADTVIISKPYSVNDCRPLGNENEVAGTALTRVRKVLEMERKKIELRNASTAMANSGNFPHAPPAHPQAEAHAGAARNNNNNNNNSNTAHNANTKDSKAAAVAVPIRNTPVRSPPPTSGPSGGPRKGG